MLKFIPQCLAAKRYGRHIKVTMSLRDVKDFISRVGKPSIEVGEDRTRTRVIVLWKKYYSVRDYPSVEVHVDKYSLRPIRVIVRDESNRVIKDEYL